MPGEWILTRPSGVEKEHNIEERENFQTEITDGRNHGRTDGQTDRRGIWNSILDYTEKVEKMKNALKNIQAKLETLRICIPIQVQ